MNIVIKVLFVIDYFKDPDAGTEGQLFQLIRGLDKTRFEPHLLVFRESPWMKKHGFICNYTVLGCQSLKSPVTWFQLLREAMRFKRKGIAVAHIFFNDPSIICPPIFRVVGIRSFISRRDMGYWYTPQLKKVLRLVRYFVDGVIVNSVAVKHITTDNEGYDCGSIHVIYNGFVESEEKEKGEIADLLALKEEGAVMVGVVANVRAIKRIEDGITAIARLSQIKPEVHLVHIGAGDKEPLRQLAIELGVQDRIHFLGGRKDVSACLKLFKVGLLCSESEGFSNAIVEYLRAGLPVVCSNVGGNPEAVIDGFNGFLYDKGDIDGLASAIRCLVENDSRREEMSRQAKADATQRFGLSKMVSSHQRLYEDASSQSRGLKHASHC